MQLSTIMEPPVDAFTPNNCQNKPIYGFVYISWEDKFIYRWGISKWWSRFIFRVCMPFSEIYACMFRYLILTTNYFICFEGITFTSISGWFSFNSARLWYAIYSVMLIIDNWTKNNTAILISWKLTFGSKFFNNFDSYFKCVFIDVYRGNSLKCPYCNVSSVAFIAIPYVFAFWIFPSHL